MLPVRLQMRNLMRQSVEITHGIFFKEDFMTVRFGKSKKALTYDSSKVYVRYNLGLAYMLLNKTEEALEHYKKAITASTRFQTDSSELIGAITDIRFYLPKIVEKEKG